MMPDEWRNEIDHLVEEIFMKSNVTAPPVHSLEIARKLGIEVALDASQATRGRQKSLDGQRLILVKPDDRPERLHWAVAHELGEIHAWKIWSRVGVEGDDAPDGLREQVANLFATRFLLPQMWFAQDASECDEDLVLLKSRYATASHELIARRMLDLQPETVLTIADQGRMTSRQNGYGRRINRLTPEETAIWRSVHDTGVAMSRAGAGFRIRGWAIHEPQWKREILLSLFTEEYESPCVEIT